MSVADRLDRWLDSGAMFRFVRNWSIAFLLWSIVWMTIHSFDGRWGWVLFYAAVAAYHAWNLRWALLQLAELERGER